MSGSGGCSQRWRNQAINVAQNGHWHSGPATRIFGVLQDAFALTVVQTSAGAFASTAFRAAFSETPKMIVEIGSASSAPVVSRYEPPAPPPASQVNEVSATAPESQTNADASSADTSAAQQSQESDPAKNGRESLESLREQIAQLEKQLAQALEELRDVQSATMDEKQKAALTAALQVKVAVLNSSLMSMMMKLAEAIANENGKNFESAVALAASQGGGGSAG